MKKRIIFLVLAIISVSVSLIIFSYLGMDNSKSNNGEKKYLLFSVEKSPPLLLKGTSQSENVKEYYLDSNLGLVESLSVKNGQSINKSDLIATYKNSLLQEEVDSLNNNLQTLSVSLNNAEESVNNIKRKKQEIQSDIENYEKEKRNLEASSEDSSKILELNSKIEQAQHELEIQDESLLQAKQLLKEASTAFSVESKNIENSKNKITTSVTSPMDGVVYIDERGLKDSTIPFAKVVSPKTIIKGTITEYDYENIKIDSVVTVKSLNQTIETKGKIYLINELPDNNSEDGSVSNYSFFVETEDSIHYGYSVHISLDLNQLKIPKEAILKVGNNYYVYKYSENRVHKTKIDIQEINGEYIVKSGLEENNKIISNPDESLKDKKEVKIDVENE